MVLCVCGVVCVRVWSVWCGECGVVCVCVCVCVWCCMCVHVWCCVCVVCVCVCACACVSMCLLYINYRMRDAWYWCDVMGVATA